ncbi:MAG: 30S ribosomal protein S7 [Candidatus Woesearchaeota archaeon]
MAEQLSSLKVFNRWSAENIVVSDPGLVRYINLTARIVPFTSGRHIGTQFHKGKVFIVERLINKLMVTGHKGKKHMLTSGYHTGKKYTATAIVQEAFVIIEQKTKKNPIEVFVKAIENAAPREEIISISYGGARYPKAVECAPQRRIDLALRYMTQGAFQKSFNTKRSIATTLADEIVNAYYLSPQSAAISKKNEMERQADSSR